MGWMQKAYETYENNIHMAGDETAEGSPLSPVSHQIAVAKIEVTINEEGEFETARQLSKDESKTLIPVTEASAGRTTGNTPHPLCDTPMYLAEDFGAYVCEELLEGIEDNKKRSQAKKDINKAITKAKAYHKAYMTQLKDWMESPYTHRKIKAIYTYCEEGNLMEDLIHAGVFQVDEALSQQKERPIIKYETIEGTVYQKCLIRWRVLSTTDGEASPATWEDTKLFDSYVNYMGQAGEEAQTDLCYVTGTYKPVATTHPKGVSKKDSNAKLISANDKSGFTYRGRFMNAQDVEVVSYEVSQKAHSALKWLVTNQGIMIGGRTFLCWNPKGKETPELPIFSAWGEEEESEAGSSSTMPEYGKKIKDYINGFVEKLDPHDDVVIMMFSAPVPGRLSVTYYNQLKASDFLQRIEKWRLTYKWYYTEFDLNKKPNPKIKSPSIKQIIDYAYGVQQDKFIKADDKIIQENVQRIIQCIVDDQPVPRELVHALAMRASMPLAYSRGNHDKVLSTACAFINQLSFGKGEENSMALDKTCTDRSYLFGRLLAIAEKVERATYDENDKERIPNAIRLQMAYQQHPFHTWRLLQEALLPYYDKLSKGNYPGANSAEKYRDMTGEILSMLNLQENLNARLEDKYLIGYYLQRMELNGTTK